MILYEHGLLGLGTLGRLHGSAVYKVFLPALLSTIVFLGYDKLLKRLERNGLLVILNPYAIGVLIAFVSFLLTFRLNYSYGRYWEAATALHNMIIRFVDCATTIAAFHYQSKQYPHKPPTFGALQRIASTTLESSKTGTNYSNNNHKNNNQTSHGEVDPYAKVVIPASRIVGRIRNYQPPSTYAQAADHLLQLAIVDRLEQEKLQKRKQQQMRYLRRLAFWNKPEQDSDNNSNSVKTNKHKSQSDVKNIKENIRMMDSLNNLNASMPKAFTNKCNKNFINDNSKNSESNNNNYKEGSIPIPVRFQEQFKRKSYCGQTSGHPDYSSKRLHENLSSSHITAGNYANEGSLHQREQSCHYQQAPSLFLQEAAHLISLLSGVALSTLRNDIDGADSPLAEYYPGKPWPPVDIDMLDDNTNTALYGEGTTRLKVVYFMLGNSRSDKRRTLYNAARPLGVLGGVSDGEIQMLKQAYGPSAKVALVSMWLQEFITREHLAGSTGDIPPPIISRLHNLVSDGVVAYHQARKIAFVPFPFPNSQIASFFSLAILFVFPLLYNEYVVERWFGCILNLLTVVCFLGLHEVARELENPFINVPNDLPLVTYQAQLNEALVTMYAGYHPDSWWDVAPSTPSNENTNPDTPSVSVLTETMLEF